MARIAIGGFQHETNTFSPHKADLAAFENVASFPRMPEGQTLIDEMDGLNVSISGFISAAKLHQHELVPSVWAMATPSAHVTDEAFDTVVGRILDGIRSAGEIDAVYLCLHGAMVTESFEDGEAEILRRVRELIGPDIPLVASLDLHGNIPEAMVDIADGMVAYRTYPHVDSAITGEATAKLLQWMLDTGKRPAKALRRTDFLIPLVWQCSLIEPAASIYAMMDDVEKDGVLSVSFTPGFPAADIAECGPSVFAYGDTQEAADRAADQIFEQVVAAREQWNGKLYSPAEAIEKARREYRGKPFVLNDTQDNPGAGGASDTVGLLEALVAADAPDAVFACLYDPDAANAAHAAGVGATLTLSVGAGSGQPGHTPFTGEFYVQAVSDGVFVGTGPMAKGRTYRMGPTAVLRIGQVEVVVTSGRAQVLDQAILRHIGIVPTQKQILAIKSSVHFRADYQPIAEDVLVTVSPGPNVANHHEVPYKNLRSGLAIVP
jgi:microcystin degradation protein MlrC